MSILLGDIKLLASDTMSDTLDSGGQFSTTDISSSVHTIFDKVSEVSRAGGSLSIRKIFAGVSTQTTDKLYGGKLLLNKIPPSSKIQVTLYRSIDWFDRLTTFKDTLTGSLVPSDLYPGYLYGDHAKGSVFLSIYQLNPSVSLKVGDVLCLDSIAKQYVKVTSLAKVTKTFKESTGDLSVTLLTLGINTPLRSTFKGESISTVDFNPTTTIRVTRSNSSWRGYSSKELTASVSAGASMLKVGSIYNYITPQYAIDTHVSSLLVDGTFSKVSGTSPETYIVNETWTPGSTHYLASSVTPATLTLVSGGVTISESGDGVLKISSTVVGSVDYDAGRVFLLTSASTITGPITVSFTPLAVPTATNIFFDTHRLQVSGASSMVWATRLQTLPTPGTLKIHYLSLGKWYTLSDDANGKVYGLVNNLGTGTVNYSNGSVSLNLGLVPDDGFSILFTWRVSPYVVNSSSDAVSGVFLEHTLSNATGKPLGLKITWKDSADRTAYLGVDNTFSGDATGTYNAATKTLKIVPSYIPKYKSEFFIAYSTGTPIKIDTLSNFTRVINNVILQNVYNSTTLTTMGIIVTTVSFYVPRNITPGYLKFTFGSSSNNGFPTSYQDDGRGGIYCSASNQSSIKVGVVNYTSGFVMVAIINNNHPGYYQLHAGSSAVYDSTETVFTPVFTPVSAGADTAYSFVTDYRTVAPWSSAPTGGQSGWTGFGTVTQWANWTITSGELVNATITNLEYIPYTDATNHIEVATLDKLNLNLGVKNNDSILPGSIAFTLGSLNYFDYMGTIYFAHQGSGYSTYGGVVDYSSGLVTLQSVNPWVANTVTLTNKSTTRTPISVSSVDFKVPCNPILPGSFSVSATVFDTSVGHHFVPTTYDSSGVILGECVSGTIDYASGTVHLDFGMLVLAAGNESEAWYNPDNVVNGHIFKPIPVISSSIVFNASSRVIKGSAPLSDVLDYDRLPSSNMVPIYQEGDLLLILHDYVVTGTYTSGFVSLGATNLARVSIVDAAGVTLPSANYTTNLSAGTVNLTNTSGYTQPLTLTGRVEEYAIASSVDITGVITLNSPLVNSYPQSGTYVASCVDLGTLYSHVTTSFSQQLWYGKWEDAQEGSEILSKYSQVQYPISVDNLSCVQERWAIIFVTETTFNVVGEHLGQVASGDIHTLLAPTNPTTNGPYFTLHFEGWGSGWDVGNVLRFNTVSAKAPVWVTQTLLPNTPSNADTTFSVEVRGGV